MININVAKELVKMYDNLTLEDFEREWCDEMWIQHSSNFYRFRKS